MFLQSFPKTQVFFCSYYSRDCKAFRILFDNDFFIADKTVDAETGTTKCNDDWLALYQVTFNLLTIIYIGTLLQ